MARPRKTESSYERRIRRYLEAHPGATRQEARGHRLPKGVRSEYQRRVAGTRPGSEERRARSGHRGFQDLLRDLRSRGEGALVGIEPTSERDSEGRWTRVRIAVLGEDGVERTYTLARRQLTDERVEQLVQTIHDAGAIESPLYPVSKLEPQDLAEAA